MLKARLNPKPINQLNVLPRQLLSELSIPLFGYFTAVTALANVEFKHQKIAALTARRSAHHAKRPSPEIVVRVRLLAIAAVSRIVSVSYHLHRRQLALSKPPLS